MALAYVAAHPQRVANMILIGCVGTDLSTVDRFGAILMTHLSAAERKAYASAQRSGNAAKALDIQLLAEFDDRQKALATIATEPRPFIYPAVSEMPSTRTLRGHITSDPPSRTGTGNTFDWRRRRGACDESVSAQRVPACRSSLRRA